MEMCTCVFTVGYEGSTSKPKRKDDQYRRCPYLCAEMPKEGGTTAGASRGAVIVGRKRALGPIGVYFLFNIYIAWIVRGTPKVEPD
jgi:hypothetical protein